MSRKISVSAISTYMECPRKYKFQYIDRRYRPSNEHFVFGTLGHKILEYIGMGLDDEVIYQTVASEQERRSVQEALSTLRITNLEALTKEYIKKLRDFLTDYEIITTEIKLEDKDNVGVIDLIAVDPDDYKLLILDYKFTNYAKKDDDIRDNLQLFMYAKLMNHMKGINAILKKYDIDNIYLGYFSLAKIESGPPKKLASGKLSKANDKRVTYETFLQVIEDNDLNRSDYADHLNKLKYKNIEQINFVEIKLTRNELEDKIKEIEAWTKIIKYATKNDLFPGREAFHCTKGGFGGKPCPIYKQCKNHL